MGYEEAYNKHDPAALAALFKEDGVRVTHSGTYYGRRAIEKSFAKDFRVGIPTIFSRGSIKCLSSATRSVHTEYGVVLIKTRVTQTLTRTRAIFHGS